MKMRKWLAAIAALIMTVCLLAGACAEGDPNALLEEDLKITDAIREAFWDERLIDTRKEYVEDAGITVMLDECVGDAHHIRAAFRVSGRHFTEDDRPEFRHIRIEVPGLDNDEPASSGFINWVENGRILGFYPLNDEGVARMRWYFLSESEESTSRFSIMSGISTIMSSPTSSLHLFTKAR